MNRKLFASAVIAAAGFAATSSFADTLVYGEVGYVPQVQPSTSNTTRAEVRADYLQAQRNGTLPRDGEVGEFSTAEARAATQSTTDVTRAQVRSEAIAAMQQRGHSVGGEV
ncbi:DUF4148 domain-containing protein [Pseudorhodoferax sp. Leaf267]|uniref:DUF4148 domain-containing protein n=1 Tax=Pseudorhodoferax sp. Leaf267 TaxID=1736316 RepID=UPI000700C4BB|nr:DUF4148 domain-containing protein [Pseudorhodoferax sp. Leaf267]KQP23080.1 hypothetical protein ASF43_04140 [Pseudorhodoferax sp. Leaf267]